MVVMLSYWALSDPYEARHDAYGRSITTGLAQLAIEPLLTQDRIALGVIANQAVDIPGVSGVEIVTVNEQALAASGSLTRGQIYRSDVSFNDQIMGSVRVALTEPASRLGDAIGVAAATLLAAPFLALALLSIRLERPVPRQPGRVEVTLHTPRERHFLIAVNLYDQLGMAPEQRVAELNYARIAAGKVAGLYGGDVENLPGTGLLLDFSDGGDEDRPWQVLSATAVLAALLDEEAGDYRLAIHAGDAPAGHRVLMDEQAVSDAALLSAVAKRGTLAASSVFSACLDSGGDLLERTIIEHPLLEELATVGPDSVLITALSGPQQDLVQHQAAHLASHRPATASESTF
ncbi:MAG: hypothetical protein GWM88_03335 [Pseudomonadales bacterium]|nr:hypothetical protein [Pseudomonadales bacterium]NIX07104.1 hypothetical protein [Pseudomonadales bacterium]